MHLKSAFFSMRVYMLYLFPLLLRPYMKYLVLSAASTSVCCDVLIFRADPSSKPVPGDYPEHRGIQEVQVGRGVCDLLRRRCRFAAGRQYWSRILSLAIQALTQIRTG